MQAYSQVLGILKLLRQTMLCSYGNYILAGRTRAFWVFTGSVNKTKQAKLTLMADKWELGNLRSLRWELIKKEEACHANIKLEIQLAFFRLEKMASIAIT